MNKSYKIPLNLFLILEKTNPIFYTSGVLTQNHIIILLQSSWLKTFATILKNEIFFCKSMLSEASALDTLSYKNNLPEIDLFCNNSRVLPFYIWYCYTLKLKITLVCYDEQAQKICSLESIDTIYKNSNWVERELAEMYGIFYKNKRDHRKLLLDYTSDIHPMLKDFPVEGFHDIFYDFFEDQILVNTTNTVEL